MAAIFTSLPQRFTRWFCVYKMSMDICTNDWVNEETSSIDASFQKWIQENSVHVRVTDYLYERA